MHPGSSTAFNKSAGVEIDPRRGLRRVGGAVTKAGILQPLAREKGNRGRAGE